MATKNRTAVVASPRYAATVERLIADPIIRDMAAGLPQSTDMDQHAFMVSSLHTYNERGGKIETHIGGPSDALKEILSMTLRFTATIGGKEVICRASCLDSANTAFADEARIVGDKSFKSGTWLDD